MRCDSTIGADQENEAEMPNQVTMEIQSWPIDRLFVYARNPRKNDAADSAFWRDLEALFRALINPVRLVATVIDGRWSRTADGPANQRERKRLRQLFDSLARRAGIAAGTPNRENALEGWLNLLRDESPYFQPFHGSSSDDGVERNYQGGWIQDLASASAEYCILCATSAFELHNAAETDTPRGLRRDRYPFLYLLHDHSHAKELLRAETRDWEARLPELAGGQKAEAEAAGPEANVVAEPERKQGYRAEVRQWMAREEVKTVAAAARRLGICQSTLKSIMSARGKRRYSEETLHRVLAIVGVQRP